MPKKLYNILDENGAELKGPERKKKLDEMRRNRIKTEQKPEQKTNENDSPTVSVIDYGADVKQPPIQLQVPEPEEEEISITEEELEQYIRQKEQKNVISPPVSLFIYQPPTTDPCYNSYYRCPPTM